MGVSRRIAQITGGAFDVKAGSLFPALHRMEQAGWFTSFWGESETNRRAKFYSLTKAGKKTAIHRVGAVGTNIPCHGDCLAHYVGGFMISRLRAFWNNVFRREQFDRDLEEELQVYVELVSAEKVQTGVNPEEAHRYAHRQTGGIDQVVQSVRDVRAGVRMDRLAQDVQYGVRTLAKNSTFSLVADRDRRKYRDVQPPGSGGSAAFAG
jgi:DNA-binding PadR family transcriptional regulator